MEQSKALPFVLGTEEHMQSVSPLLSPAQYWMSSTGVQQYVLCIVPTEILLPSAASNTESAEIHATCSSNFTVVEHSDVERGGQRVNGLKTKKSTYLQDCRLAKGPRLAVQTSRQIVSQEVVQSLDLPRERRERTPCLPRVS